MGSLFRRGSKIWMRIKDRAGKWQGVPSGLAVGHEKEAWKAMRLAEDRMAAEIAVDPGSEGPLVFKRYAEKWLEGRKGDIESWENDESRLRLYVYSEIGELLLADVRPRHLLDLIRKLRKKPKQNGKGKLAPRTIYNCYAVLCAIFRDAAVEGLIDTSPCILTSAHLGPKVDADPLWRNDAHYTRTELELLISDRRLDEDHRVLWGLMGIGGVRPGEAFGLRIREVKENLEPLGSMFIATSHGRGRTKTNVSRPVPIHPTLAVLLRDWLSTGWAKTMGRAPTSTDLLIPLPKSSKGEAGRMRTNSGTLKTLHDDLDLLGIEWRRVQDLRHTMISLSRSDGAEKDILRRVTHQPPKEVIEGYTHYQWEVVCREVAKLKVRLPETPKMPPPEGHPHALATLLATDALRQSKTPENLSALGGFSLRGVGDLNP